MDVQKFYPVNTQVKKTVLNNESVIQVVKNQKIMEFDENTFAKLENRTFHNGEIKVQVLSRLLSDAPEFARGFIGISFRINDDNTKFESFYVRPTNGRIDDPIRSHRAVQYFSYPKFTFSYFRDHNIKEFEGPADIGLDEWITLKIIVNNDQADFFVNNMDKPILSVDELKMGAQAEGSIGLFVDVGTEGYFRNLEIADFD